MELMKKIPLIALVAAIILLFVMSGCTAPAFGGEIHTVGRDTSSGTRLAFHELALDKDEPTYDEEVNSNGAVHDKVATTRAAIGYVGLGYLDEEVKAVTIDGVVCSEATVLDTTYPISRSLNMFTNETPAAGSIVKQFLDFVMSAEGQALVSEEGFVALATANQTTFTADLSLKGTITIGGSTTVQPIASLCAEEFEKKYPAGAVTVSVTGGGSTTGVTGVIDGTFDIGMASRELKSEEPAYLEDNKFVVAYDGIAVIVHLSNPIDNLSIQQVYDIFMGNITTWDELIT